MQENQTALSPHVQRLVNEGYTITLVEDKHIIVDNVPYVSAPAKIDRAAIISAYYYKDGKENLGDHTAWFTGGVPCTANGEQLASAMIADTNVVDVAGRRALCRFSYKSERPETLANIYNKLTHYIRKLQGYANVIDPSVSASAKGSISVRQERSVFLYPNTAIARAGLDAYEEKLKLAKIAIIGLGGTGSYILDALAKTPINEIHLYDDDFVEPATAYRMPGALTIGEAHNEARKTDHHRDTYLRMRTGIVSHPVRIDQANLHELDDCKFVFLAVDDGPSRGLIARYLVGKDIPFIDAGMGVDRVPEVTKLIARVRVTAIDSQSKALLDKLPVANDQEDAVYNNIQVAELNALNAMLAVIIYKQKIGFYSEEIAVNALRYILAWQRLLTETGMKVKVLTPEYVEQFPDEIKQGVLYISEPFGLTAHKCCCGCGEDVYLKLGPAKWRLSKMPDGSVSLDPSVGNWNYACHSHYWIDGNRVIDAGPMDADEIEAVKRRDRRDRDRHIARVNARSEHSRGVWGHLRSLAASALGKLKAAWPW